MLYTTPKCIGCKQTTQLTIPKERYLRWKNGELIQRAFDYMSADERELIMTGTHAECWDKLFPDE